MNGSNSIVIGLITIVGFMGVSYPLFALPRFWYPVVPDSDRSVCYMQTNDGLVWNLDQLCGQEESGDLSSTELLSARDRLFIEEYKQLLLSFPGGESQLLAVEANPQAIVRRAIELCNELRISSNRSAQLTQLTQSTFDRDILTSLAPEYYCREFDD